MFKIKTQGANKNTQNIRIKEDCCLKRIQETMSSSTSSPYCSVSLQIYFKKLTFRYKPINWYCWHPIPMCLNYQYFNLLLYFFLHFTFYLHSTSTFLFFFRIRFTWMFWPCYIRNIFHILKHLLFDYSVHRNIGTGDQGACFGRNTSINYTFFCNKIKSEVILKMSLIIGHVIFANFQQIS